MDAKHGSWGPRPRQTAATEEGPLKPAKMSSTTPRQVRQEMTKTPKVEPAQESNTPSLSSTKRKAEDDGTTQEQQEKRKRRFRPQPPQAFFEIYGRATSQRFFVLSRKRIGTLECPEEEIEMTGSTGNIYTVHISQKPSCSCPHSKKGHQCKHWLWVMSRVLRAQFKHVYQLALLSSELQEIFDAAPPIETDVPGAKSSHDKNRKPVEGDCPICYSELEEAGKESIVWCRAACGQNIHKVCFETWAKTKRQSGGLGARGDVTCPLCRSVWDGDKDVVQRVQKNGPANGEGYVNVADQLGIASFRDESTYYSGPRRGYRGYSRGYGRW